MQSSGSAKPAPKKSRKELLWLVVIIIIVAAFVSALLQFTLMQSGQVITLNPGYFYYVNFTVPSGAYSISVTGSYVSGGDVNAALIFASEFSIVESNPSTMANGLWYSGDNTGATISASLSQGSYTLIFYNSNLITRDIISVVDAITVTYSG